MTTDIKIFPSGIFTAFVLPTRRTRLKYCLHDEDSLTLVAQTVYFLKPGTNTT